MPGEIPEESGLRKRAGKNNERPDKKQITDAEHQKIVVKRLRDLLHEKANDIFKELQNRIVLLKKEVVREIESFDEHNGRHIEAFSDKSKNGVVRNGPKGSSAFEDKIFVIRDSLLSELFRIPHIKTIYHIFIAFLINLVISTALHDYVKDGKVTLGFRIIYWNFKALPTALLVWLGMQTFTFFAYYAFVVWGTVRTKLPPNSFTLRSWDHLYAIFNVFYLVFMLVVPTIAVVRLNFAVALSLAVLSELVRFLMKTYSFVRSCSPRVLARKNDRRKGNASEFIPDIKKFCYFLFAPTLIYRDEYPRTQKIRWKTVICHFLEVLGVICFLAFMYENYMLPLVQDFGKTPMGLEDLLLLFLGINTPAILYFVLGFFMTLHSWMNAFAEMLRFGDRMFYQDWWNSGSLSEYYKKWNVVVHDWLYTFVYRDATENLTHNKAFSAWLVFLVSAVFHEFILAFSFKFCYPVLFVVFGILSTCLYFVPRRFFVSAGNLILWFMLIVGVGFCSSLYFMECFARINCPQTVSSPILDFFTPRSWSCGVAF